MLPPKSIFWKAIAAGLALAASLSAPQRGEADDAPAPLAWSDLVRTAAAQNPGLSAARRAEQAALDRLKGSYNGFLPAIGLSQRYSDSNRRSPGSRWSAQADASLDVFNRGNYYDIKASAAARDEAAARLRLASADLRLRLFTAYANLLFSQEEVKVASTIRELRRNNAQMVALKYQSGRESKGNSLRAEAELTQAEADLAQARRDLKAAQAELNRALGSDAFNPLTVTGTWTTGLLPPEPDTAALLESNPQFAVAQAGVAQARADLERTRSNHWPTLSANYARTFQDRTYFPKNPGWSAGGVLSWPLFGQGPTAPYHNISAARNQLRVKEEDRRAAQHGIRSSLASAWADWAGKADRVRVQEDFLRAALQRNDEASIRYTSGLMSFENWEIVVSDLVNFEKGFLRAKRDASLAEAAWRHALGNPLEEP